MSRVMACAVALAVAGLANAAAADPLVLQLRGPAQFQYAGYYAALWQGFYAEAGLTVDIQPGAPRGQTPTASETLGGAGEAGGSLGPKILNPSFARHIRVSP